MKTSNVMELPVFIDVYDVMRSMKCSRTMAYAHMRSALGRIAGERGQLRVPLYVWHRYVLTRFDREHGATPSRPASSPEQETRSTSPIPLTRPRTKPRAPADRT
jgi:hypothetical protein